MLTQVFVGDKIVLIIKDARDGCSAEYKDEGWDTEETRNMIELLKRKNVFLVGRHVYSNLKTHTIIK